MGKVKELNNLNESEFDRTVLKRERNIRAERNNCLVIDVRVENDGGKRKNIRESRTTEDDIEKDLNW